MVKNKRKTVEKQMTEFEKMVRAIISDNRTEI